MSAAAPWSVKGIDPKAREVAKDLARRSGMTLGEWLNSMIMEDEDDEGVVPMPRRPQATETFDRRGRSRRMDDAYQGEQPWYRLEASVDAIAARLEAAERRSTLAVQGIDQAVAGLLRRLDGQDTAHKLSARRLDEMAEEVREGHRRVRKFENETAPKTDETFVKVEAGLGALAGRLYDIEERQRLAAVDLRQRMEAVEQAAGPGVGSELLAQVGQRLDQAQGQTSQALKGLERTFAALDLRLREAESRIEPEGAREAARFEKLAETLSRQVETNRVEMMRRLDTAETEGRLERIERASLTLVDQLRASEDRSAKAVEAMGREVLRIAQNLNGRVAEVEARPLSGGTESMAELGQVLSRKIENDLGRLVNGVEQRLEQRQNAADDRHAIALERLGGEITRISDRLSERIAESERRSAHALEDIGRRLLDNSSRIEQRYDRASGELAERMRMSEERTASLIAEARDNIERRATTRAALVAEPEAFAEPDWRAAAFPDTAFPDAALSDSEAPASPFATAVFDDPVYEEQQAWSAELAAPEASAPEEPVETRVEPEGEPEPISGSIAAPFGSRLVAPEPAVFASEAAPSLTAQPFGAVGAAQAFGGADVSDALAATDLDDLSSDDFDGDTEFVDPRATRAAAAQGRAATTRSTLDAARAAMSQPAEPEREAKTSRFGFGLKRGGKSKLQERLDRQAKGGDTIRKTLGASGVAIVLTAGGALAFSELTGAPLGFAGAPAEAEPAAFAALATTATTDRGGELYATAMDQIDAGETTGVDTLKQAATIGHAPAQLHLAGLYQNGVDGVSTNPALARSWARKAAEQGDARGMHAYAMYLFDGTGGPSDPGRALDWLTRAAERGYVDSQYNAARILEDGGDGVRKDTVKAYAWYLTAARTGDGDAQAAADRLGAVLSPRERGLARAQADKLQATPAS